MTIGRFRLSKEWKEIEGRKPDELMEVPGSLGITKGGTRQVEVSGRDGFVYVRIRDQLSEVVQVYNDQVSPVYDLPVIITRNRTDMNRWRIKGRDLGRYGNWGSTSYLPNHGGQHSFPIVSPGADPVWVYARQIMPLAATPSGSASGMGLYVKDFTYQKGGVWKYFPDTITSSFASYKPTGASNAALTLLYLDDAGTLQYLKGSEFAIVTGTANIVPHIPASPGTCLFPIAGIYLLTGTSILDWDNIYDARPFFTSSAGTSGGVTDHGALTGLLDNDHPQYMLTGTVSGGDSYNVCCGRLSLATGTAIPMTDLLAATSVKFVPHKGNLIGVYDGAAWSTISFSETSLDISGYTTDKNYDIFAYNNAGTLALEGLIWTNDTTRATALINQDGVLVKSGATTKRYLGTIRMSNTGECEDSLDFRGVWNYYNQVERRFYIGDATNHLYETSSWRYWNNTSTWNVEFVIGVVERPNYLSMYCNLDADKISVGYDVTNASLNKKIVCISPDGNPADFQYLHVPNVGYHYYAVIEYGAGSYNFYEFIFDGYIMG